MILEYEAEDDAEPTKIVFRIPSMHEAQWVVDGVRPPAPGERVYSRYDEYKVGTTVYVHPSDPDLDWTEVVLL